MWCRQVLEEARGWVWNQGPTWQQSGPGACLGRGCSPVPDGAAFEKSPSCTHSAPRHGRPSNPWMSPPSLGRQLTLAGLSRGLSGPLSRPRRGWVAGAKALLLPQHALTPGAPHHTPTQAAGAEGRGCPLPRRHRPDRPRRGGPPGAAPAGRRPPRLPARLPALAAGHSRRCHQVRWFGACGGPVSTGGLAARSAGWPCWQAGHSAGPTLRRGRLQLGCQGYAAPGPIASHCCPS